MNLKSLRIYVGLAGLALATLIGHAQSVVIGLPSGSGTSDYNALSNKPKLSTGQMLYNQSGDTVASIETACSSLCTYIVTTPQTMTLAANHTLSSNVQLDFRAGGLWTVNGAFTLTIPGNVTGTLNRHFAGTSTVKFGYLQAQVPVEWFGAVGDWNGTTGTDNTTAIQAALNSLTHGQIVLQQALYKTTATLTTSTSAVGIHGTMQGGALSTQTPSGIVITSASADAIDVAGASSSAYLEYNAFDGFAVERSVAPTGTAAGLSFNYVAGAVVENVQSMDSARGFYFHGFPSRGVGRVENCLASFGFGSVTGYTGTLSGFYLDSADGNPEFSFRGRHLQTSSSLALGSGVHGFDVQGTAIQDVMVYGFESAAADYGIVVIHTGSTPYTTGDIHFYGSTLDGGQHGVYVSGATAATNGGVEFTGGYILNAFTGVGSQVDIENSSGVSVLGMEIGPFNAAVTNGVLLNNSSANVISSNRLKGISKTGIALTGSSSSNTVAANTISGSGQIGVLADGTSTNNTGLETNSVASTFAKTLTIVGANPLVLPGVPTIVSTTFNEGTAGTGITGTLPAIGPGAAWATWPTLNSLTFKSGGGANAGATGSWGNTLNLGTLNYTATFSGLTNTNGSDVFVRFDGTNNWIGVLMLGAGGVSLVEEVNGTNTTIGNDPITSGATGSVVITVNGNSVTATPFGGSPITYTIPVGHGTLTGQNVGILAATGAVYTYGGVSVVGLPQTQLSLGSLSVDSAGNVTALSSKNTVYTVAALPAASSLPAGTQVMVSDATSFTPGTCTGGGSDYMLAVTNGTTWSCH